MEETTMAKAKVSYTIYAVVWANIKRYQYIYGISDESLSKMFGVTTRTIYSYDKDPSPISLKCLQSFIENTGISFETLFVT